jgi:hypothetical protein
MLTGGNQSLHDVLAALEARLEQRFDELNDEIAHYPSPIARCDEQLTKLIEQRSECLGHLRAVRAIRATDAALDCGSSPPALVNLLRGYAYPEDAEERALVAHLKAIAS